MLHNTGDILAQLQRDQIKIGAHQAKIKYAKYLANINFDDPTYQRLLDEVIQDVNTPAIYHQEAQILKDFYQAKIDLEINKHENHGIQLLEKIVNDPEAKTYCPNEYNHALDLLRTHFRANLLYSKLHDYLPKQKAEPESQIAMDPTPEYSYKMTRGAFNRQMISVTHYVTQLKKILNHPERTDTLSAKIYFQLIYAYLLIAQKTGLVKYLHLVKINCEELIQNPCLKSMHKTDNAKIILNTLNVLLQKEVNLESMQSNPTKNIARKILDLKIRHPKTPHRLQNIFMRGNGGRKRRK